jgi:hypothetical protein
MNEPTDRAEPMQGLAEWLRAQNHRYLPQDIRQRNERWASEVEASRQRPAAPKFGCHCDLENTVSGQPDECVFDNGDIEDCIYATQLHREEKGKTDCKYWQPIKFASPERPAAQAASAWMPIETAPQVDGEPVLLLVNGEVSPGCWVEVPFVEHRDGDGTYIDQTDAAAFWMSYKNGECEPTHWMPLPAAPGSEVALNDAYAEGRADEREDIAQMCADLVWEMQVSGADHAAVAAIDGLVDTLRGINSATGEPVTDAEMAEILNRWADAAQEKRQAEENTATAWEWRAVHPQTGDVVGPWIRCGSAKAAARARACGYEVRATPPGERPAAPAQDDDDLMSCFEVNSLTGSVNGQLQDYSRLAAAPAQAAVTDEQIESTFQKSGGAWNGDRWVIEDANLHPFARALLAQASPVQPSGVDAQWVEKFDELVSAAEAWGATNVDDKAGMLASELRLSNAIVDFREARRTHLSTALKEAKHV